jgi:protein NrfD
MALSGLGLFLLEACAGTAFLLLFFPPKVLGRGFFSLHGGLAAGFAALTLLVRPAGLPFTVAAVATALLAAYTLAAHLGRAAEARPLLALGAGTAGWCLARVALVAPREAGGAWTVVGAAAGGLLFGAVLVIMNLGHWYLVSRSLPFRLLARGAALFGGLVLFRTAYLGVALGFAARSGSDGLHALLSLESDALFFLFRVLWGIVGPLALSYFIWRTAEMKSNQAATGLLYVALVFVLIGELLSSYLTVATGFPA